MALQTAIEVQRFVQSCVHYANDQAGYRKFRVEYHNVERDFERILEDTPGISAREARQRAMSKQFYTYYDERTETSVIHLPQPSTDMSREEALLIQAGTLHETLHWTEATFTPELEEAAPKLATLKNESPLKMLHNQLEDHRIERLDCEKFDGDARILEQATQMLGGQLNDALKNGAVNFEAMSDETKKIYSVHLVDLIARQNWMNLGSLASERVTLSPDETNDIADRLIDAGIDEEIANTETSVDTWHLAKRIFEELFDEDVEQHMDNYQKPEDGEGEGDASAADGKSSEGSDEDGEVAEGEKGVPPDEYEFLEFLRRATSVPHRESKGNPSGIDQHIDYDSYFKSGEDFGSFPLVPVEEMGVANFATGFYRNPCAEVNLERLVNNERRAGRYRSEYQRVFDDNSVAVNALANKIRRLLQVQSQARWIPGATSGRIQRSRAYRAALPTMGDGHYNKEIFKRRHQADTLDVAVSILVDFSGSMGGEKSSHAMFGGYILADAIGRVLRVPTQVSTFSDAEGYASVICVLKNWGENVNRQEYINRACRATETMGNNDDASAISYTYADILNRPEKRKIIIVLSDGSPATWKPGDCMKATQEVVKDIEQSKRVEIYGIGICDRNVRHIYSEYETIDQPDEIESAILTTVKKRLIV